MNNFNEIITKALSEGKTLDQISKEITDALNEVSQSESYIKDEYLKDCLNSFIDAYEVNNVDVERCVNILTYYMSFNHKDWTVDNFKAFKKAIMDQINVFEKVMNYTAMGHDTVDVFVKTIGDLLNNNSEDDKKLANFLNNFGLL